MNTRGLSAVITGASRGLGEALAHKLAQRGAKVVLVARGEEDLGRVVEAIRRAGGEALHHAECSHTCCAQRTAVIDHRCVAGSKSGGPTRQPVGRAS